MGARIREIAEIAGVSQSTVSLVLNDKDGVGMETRKRVKDILKEHEYKQDKLPIPRKSNLETICIVRFIEANNPIEDQSFVLSLIENLYDECYRHKIRPYVMMCDTPNYREVLANAISKHDDGIDIIGMEMNHEQAEYVGKLDFCGIPTVVMGNGMSDTNISTVNLANREESHMALKCLYDNGFRSVGYLHSTSDQWGFAQRAIGFDQGIADLGMECALKLTIESTITGAHFDMQNWLKKGLHLPRAFFADNDNTALGAMAALQEAGYKIPEDISLIGMDNIVYSAFSACPLTTIHISRTQMAKATMDYLMNEIPKSDVRIFCRGRLIVRESTRKFDPTTESKRIRK